MKKYLLAMAIVFIALAAWVVVNVRKMTAPSPIFRRPARGAPRPGLSNRVILSGGQPRGYWLFVPHGYYPSASIPLVISLHGYSSSAGGQRYLSRWEKLAEKENFCVVYPQGTGKPLRWNSSNFFGPAQVDDVAFMRDLLADLQHWLSIDSRRIYVNGMSNGGTMTARLASEMADVFAAVGIVSGPPSDPPGGFQSLRPVPLIAFYGTADPLVKYHGGTADTSLITRLIHLQAHRATFPPVRPWIAAWAQRNGCGPVPESLPTCGDVTGERYTGSQPASEVVFYTISGGGHTWPGGSPIPVGKTSRSIDATAEMWAFFKAHVEELETARPGLPGPGWEG